MKKLNLFLFILFLLLLSSQSLYSQDYLMTEEQYQTFVQNLKKQTLKMNLLDNQLLTLKLQLEQAENQLKTAEENSKNLGSQLEKMKKYSEVLENRKLSEYLTIGSVSFALGIVTSTIFFLIVKK